MKLSNKILLGFFGFIFLYLTAAFAEIRLTGTRNGYRDDANSITETADLSHIAYLVVRDMNRNIDVIGSGEPRLEVRSMSGGLLKNLTYKISGDTLVLSGFESEENEKTVRISVYVPDAVLKGIAVTSSIVSMKGFQQEFLNISQNAARIYLTDSKISKVQMDATNGSNLYMNDADADTLSATIDGSQVVANDVGILQGSMKNNATLFVDNVRELQFKKDESSNLHL